MLKLGERLLPPTSVAANRNGMELPPANGATAMLKLVLLAVMDAVTGALLTLPSFTVGSPDRCQPGREQTKPWKRLADERMAMLLAGLETNDQSEDGGLPSASALPVPSNVTKLATNTFLRAAGVGDGNAVAGRSLRPSSRGHHRHHHIQPVLPRSTRKPSVTSCSTSHVDIGPIVHDGAAELNEKRVRGDNL